MKRKTLKPQVNVIIIFLLMLWFFPIYVIWADSIDLFEHGNDLVEQEEYTQALGVYKQFVEKNPEHRLTPIAVWTIANIYKIILQDYDSAVEYYNRLASMKVNFDWMACSYDRMGDCFEEQEKWQEAAEVYKPAILILSGSSIDARTSAQIDRLTRKLLLCYRNADDKENMINVYKESIARDPAAQAAPEFQFDLAQAYLEANKPKAAAENFALVVERYPGSNYAQQVYNEQTELLATELAYDWTRFSTFQSAVNLSQAGQYDSAVSLFDEITRSKQNTGMEYAIQFQKDLIEFRKNGDAVALNSIITDNADSYLYGFGGMNINRLSVILRLIIEAQETIASYPEDIGAYSSMGYGYYQMRAHSCGIDAYKQGLTLEPDNKNLINMLGYCYIGAQEYDNALKTFDHLIEVDPDDPNSYDSKAEAYYMSGDTTMAIEYYQKSLAVNSEFSNPYFMLGRIFHEQGHNDKAVEYLERYLEFNPGNEYVQRLLEQVKNPETDNDE